VERKKEEEKKKLIVKDENGKVTLPPEGDGREALGWRQEYGSKKGKDVTIRQA